jgi:MFS family permease
MSAVPEASTSPETARSRVDVRRVVILFILSALPAVAATAFGPGALEDQTLVKLYVLTLPWSLALSAIAAGFAGGWFGPDERKQIFAAAGILLVAALVGRAIAPGASLDEHFQGGSPVVVASEVIVFGVIGYALVYGWPMWVASFFVAAYVGWWVHRTREPEEVVVQAASTPALTTRVIQTTPARPLSTAVAPRTPTLPPPVAEEAPTRPRQDDLAGLTKAELYARAREVGLKGRSAMSKAELLAALRANP